GISTPDLILDCRDLPAAAHNSHCLLPPFQGDLSKGTSIAIQHCFLTAQPLPALDDYVYVFRIEFDAIADASSHLGSSQSGTAAQKRFVNKLTALSVVQDRSAHQFHRLLRRVVKLVLIRSAHDELG